MIEFHEAKDHMGVPLHYTVLHPENHDTWLWLVTEALVDKKVLTNLNNLSYNCIFIIKRYRDLASVIANTIGHKIHNFLCKQLKEIDTQHLKSCINFARHLVKMLDDVPQITDSSTVAAEFGSVKKKRSSTNTNKPEETFLISKGCNSHWKTMTNKIDF